MQPLRNLGDYIRDQRTVSQVSLRQLAAAAGVSNPYLSQIERGLRKPSAEILQQLAKALRISAEALYVQAGILDERMSGAEVATAILADATLSERQKQVLLEIYDSFRTENESPEEPAATPTPEPPAAKKAAAKRAAAKQTAAKKAAGTPAKKAVKRPAPIIDPASQAL